jgi:hypothetical protein
MYICIYIYIYIYTYIYIHIYIFIHVSFHSVQRQRKKLNLNFFSSEYFVSLKLDDISGVRGHVPLLRLLLDIHEDEAAWLSPSLGVRYKGEPQYKIETVFLSRLSR